MEYSYEPIIPNRDLPFKMFQFEGMNGNYVREKHWHQEIEIFAVFKGSLTFFLGEKPRTLAEGQLILVNSNEIHSIRAPKPNTTLVVQIPLTQFREYLSPAGLISFHHGLSDQDPETIRLLQALFEAYLNQETGRYFRVQSLYYDLLYRLVTRYQIQVISPEVESQNQNLNKLSRITDYISKNYARDLSLESLARVFHYSPTYLAHMFKRYAGITFKAYLQSIRLEHARSDMDTTEKSLGEIASTNGFANPKAFSHAFRQQFGLLPSQYRRNAGDHIQ